MTGILVFVATLGTTPGVVAGELVFRVAEAAAQSLPIHALGRRPGAAEAAAEFDVLLDRLPQTGSRSRPGTKSPMPGSPT